MRFRMRRSRGPNRKNDPDAAESKMEPEVGVNMVGDGEKEIA